MKFPSTRTKYSFLQFFLNSVESPKKLRIERFLHLGSFMMKKKNSNQDASSSEIISQLKLLNSILIEENKKLKQQNEELIDENRKLQDKNKKIMAEKLVIDDQTTKIQDDNFQNDETFNSMFLSASGWANSDTPKIEKNLPKIQDDFQIEKTFKENSALEENLGDDGQFINSQDRTLKKIIHKCGICNKTFKYQSLFKNHYKITHQDVKDFDCEFCNKSFSTKARVVRHLKDVHYGIKNYKCPKCDKAFCQKSQLQVHVKSIHEDSRDHVCVRCNKSFSLSSNLKVHIANVHEKLVTYVCKMCQKRFNHSNSYNRHIATMPRQCIARSQKITLMNVNS